MSSKSKKREFQRKMADIRWFYQRFTIPQFFFENEHVFWQLLCDDTIDEIFSRLWVIACDHLDEDPEKFVLDAHCEADFMPDSEDEFIVYIRLPYVKYSKNLALFISIFFKEGKKPRLFLGETDQDISMGLFFVELTHKIKKKKTVYERINFGLLETLEKDYLLLITNKPDIRLDTSEYMTELELKAFLEKFYDICYNKKSNKKWEAKLVYDTNGEIISYKENKAV